MIIDGRKRCPLPADRTSCVCAERTVVRHAIRPSTIVDPRRTGSDRRGRQTIGRRPDWSCPVQRLQYRLARVHSRSDLGFGRATEISRSSTGRACVEKLKVPSGVFDAPRVSPDGKRVALGIDDVKGANIWIYDLSGASSIRQLTFGGRNRFPVWTADGQRVAFQSDREGDRGIFWQRADGTDTAQRLTKPDPGALTYP